MTTKRPLNWAGWSLPTIAAVYESDAAAKEAEADPENESAQAYLESAWRAELFENDLDLQFGTKE